MRTSAITKVGPKFQVVIPKKLRETARIKVGDSLRAELRREGILLKPATLVERDFKAELERELREAMAEVKAGRVLGPFDNARDVLRAARAFARKRVHAGAYQRKVRGSAR
jgi:AbrB family looped-hinge helix DNA binding protein